MILLDGVILVEVEKKMKQILKLLVEKVLEELNGFW